MSPERADASRDCRLRCRLLHGDGRERPRFDDTNESPEEAQVVGHSYTIRINVLRASRVVVAGRGAHVMRGEGSFGCLPPLRGLIVTHFAVHTLETAPEGSPASLTVKLGYKAPGFSCR